MSQGGAIPLFLFINLVSKVVPVDVVLTERNNNEQHESKSLMGDKIIKTCSESELLDWAKTQWEEFTSLLNQAVLILPKDYQRISYDDSAFQVQLVDGAVTVDPAPYQAKSILGIRERPGWLVTTWKMSDETESSVAELYPHDEQETAATTGAVYYAMKHAFDLALLDFMRKHDEEMQAKEFQENPHDF